MTSGIRQLLTAAAMLLAFGAGCARAVPASQLTHQWISADPHIHARYCTQLEHEPAELLQRMVDADLQVASVLLYSESLSSDEERALVTGRDHPVSLPGRILHYDAEVSAILADRGGHIVILGLSSMDFLPNPAYNPLSGITVTEWATNQDKSLLIGGAHGQWLVRDENFPIPQSGYNGHEFPIRVALGKVHFLEIESQPELIPMWVKLLNSGFRLPIAGASDFDCLNPEVGSPRTYVLIEGEPSYAAFVDGMRMGRTVLSSNKSEWLNLTINGTGIGGELRAASGAELDAVIETNTSMDGEVELLVNGQVVERVPVKAGRGTAKMTVSLNSSSWLAARTANALTSPVYVLVDGQPIRASAADACYLVRYVDFVMALVSSAVIDMGTDTAATLATYSKARKVFAERFLQSGGTTCTSATSGNVTGSGIRLTDAATNDVHFPADVDLARLGKPLFCSINEQEGNTLAPGTLDVARRGGGSP